ncbi:MULTISPECIES: GNAT family N-acetyltransferase [Enterococcus]|uniref:N-acetyltransferase domain-containing protein n=1 Tax=Enterococcus sulfureus ATCC 49903 TaxID=1140003 RepID=S0NQV6_9ENTE|nr:GNAT family N-acetyltransferase [Enterococcus sulfureus]EOT47006.1 hypothetical protein OMY_01256 [Enterococcus sulfureus ATCC 49903]EOT83699.1 hypothetical protein I573_01424 [Enterococcus sulfureus ATCC 49903]
MNIYHTTDIKDNIYQDALALRQAVFVVEQHVPETLEIDELEDKTIHFVGYKEDEAIATARILPLSATKAKLQRMAVRQQARGQQAGATLIQFIENSLQQQGFTTITLGAQLSAKGFYERLGYHVASEIFLDAGIEHVTMEKTL